MMKETICSLVDRLAVKKTKGIFTVPKEIASDRGINRWINAPTPTDQRLPQIIQEEDYYRGSILEKIDASLSFINKKLIPLGLLRLKQGDEYSNTQLVPLDTLSIAQVVSWKYRQPIEDILISDEKLKSQINLELLPPKRMDTLFHAYSGALWFERFILNQRRLLKVLKVKELPVIKEFDRIGKTEAARMLNSGLHKENIFGKLYQRGFITGNKANPYFFVDPMNLAHFFAKVYDVPVENILEEGQRGSRVKHLENLFVRARVKPYLEKKEIDPFRKYYIPEAETLTGISQSRIRKEGRYKKNSSTEEKKKYCMISLTGEQKKYRIKGLELALLALKRTEKESFTSDEINELFGIKGIEWEYFGIHRSENERYSARHNVFHLYDEVAKLVKQRYHHLEQDKISEENRAITW